MTTPDSLPPKTDWHILLRLLAYIKPYRRYLAGAIVITVVVSALGPLRPWLFRHAIDTAIATGINLSLLWWGLIIGGTLLAHASLMVAQSYVLQWIGQQTLHDIRRQVFDHVLHLPFRVLDTTPVGRLVTRATNDVEALNELFSSGVVMFISDILVLIWLLVFMFLTDVQLTLYALAVIPLLIIAAVIFRTKVRAAYDAIRVQVARMNAFLNEYLQGISTIHLFNYFHPQAERFDAINREHARLQLRTITYYAVFFPVVEFLSVLALCLVLVAAFDRTIGGTISMGTLVSFMMYGEMFFRPIRDLTEKYNILQTATTASSRIFALLDQAQESVSDSGATTPATPITRSVVFYKVSFSYDGITPVLCDLSFEIPAGSMVGIVGATGSGKSTIASLLLKFYEPQKGSILIDGVELRRIETYAHRQRCGIVLQEAFLFSRPVQDNIVLGRAVSSQHLWERLYQSHPELVQRLRHLQDISERGGSLSSGEKQIIALLRAIVGNPDLLILDEATAHVDSYTEQVLMDIIADLRGRMTIVAIAHRLATIKDADNIIVLHNGRIVEQGTHSKLLEQNGYYAHLYRVQQLEAATFAPTTTSLPTVAKA